jgi:FMNH2-dependent dimethyl sulfone monooxygenase
MTALRDQIKFAYWVPNVSGGLVISKIEQRTGWDINYNRRLAQIAEDSGFDYALSQIRFTAGYGAEFQHESVAFSHALLAATKKLKVIAALLPGPWNPALAAKQIATISHLSEGRVAVNVVSGWFRGEFSAIGEPWLDHDERFVDPRNSFARCAESGRRTILHSAAISIGSATIR